MSGLASILHPGPAHRGSRSGAERAETEISRLARLGLAGRTGFYAILTAITVRIALLGGRSGPEADAHGALAIVSRPFIGKVAIAAVGAGFVLFGLARIVGAIRDDSVSSGRRALTVLQGLFYLVLASVPISFLAGNHQTGSQQQQDKNTAEVLRLPGGREILIAAGLIFIGVCAFQIRGAWQQSFRDGLDLSRAPRIVRSTVSTAGVVGITARALVFLPVGVFLIVAAVEASPGHAYGTDAELLKLSGHSWGIAVLAAVAAGLTVFVVFSAIETGYRKVISAK